MKIRFSVDRIEGDGRFTVCFDDDQKKYVFPSERVGLGAGQLFYAELDDEGYPVAVEPLPEETAERRRELHSRTSALFRRNKNN